MIPILYESTETAFTSNGLGRIPCTRCLVAEQKNGAYTCEFTVSVDEAIYPQITEGRIIYCIHDDAKDGQPFDIVGRTAEMSGLVTFYAQHISYRLRKITIRPFTANSCSAALDAVGTYSINTNPFTYWTDKSTTGSFKLQTPKSARAVLCGEDGSILDVYGKGEYKFDGFTVRLYTNRGNDNGVSIRYGKNLTDIRRDTSTEDYYNAVAPYWKAYDADTVVMLPEYMIVNASQSSGGVKCIPLDLSDEFSGQPTVEQLRTKAQEILDASEGWVMKDNIVVDFVSLWQTTEYADIAALERVSLCDKVTIIHPKLGVAANKIQVIAVEYDVLAERYTKMELGSVRNTFAQVIKTETVRTVMSQVPTSDVMQEAIAHATDMITGVNGGNVIINRYANGKPYELLIMDTDSVMTAVNVWRWNLNGLGHSHNGYGGPYNDVALTADGQINANLITTGVLRAIQIINGNGTFVANADGSVTASAINITGGSIHITTATDNYDVIKLSYQLGNDTKSIEVAPLNLILKSEGNDPETGVSTNYYQNIQAAGTFYHVDSVLRAFLGAKQLCYYDDNETMRVLMSYNGITIYDADGDIRGVYGDQGWTIKDTTGTTRIYSDIGNYNIYFKDADNNTRASIGKTSLTYQDASGTVRAYYQPEGTTLYNDSGVRRIYLSTGGLYTWNDNGTYTSRYADVATYYGTDGQTVRSTFGVNGANIYDSNGDLSATVKTVGLTIYGDNGSGGRQARAYYQAGAIFYYTADGAYRGYYGYDGCTIRDASEKIRTTINTTGVAVRDTSETRRATYAQLATTYYDTDGTALKAVYSDVGMNLYGTSGIVRNGIYKEGQALRDANGTVRYLLQANMIQMFDDYSNERVRLGTNTLRLLDSTGTKRAGVYLDGTLGSALFELCNSQGEAVTKVTDTFIGFCDYTNASGYRQPSGYYGIHGLDYYDQQHVNRVSLFVTDGLKFYNSSSTKVSEYAEGGVEIRDVASGSNICAKVTENGFDIRNASPYGLTIDGQGHSTSLGAWQWKQFVSTDNRTCWVPCFVPN